MSGGLCSSTLLWGSETVGSPLVDVSDAFNRMVSEQWKAKRKPCSEIGCVVFTKNLIKSHRILAKFLSFKEPVNLSIVAAGCGEA